MLYNDNIHYYEKKCKGLGKEMTGNRIFRRPPGKYSIQFGIYTYILLEIYRPCMVIKTAEKSPNI